MNQPTKEQLLSGPDRFVKPSETAMLAIIKARLAILHLVRKSKSR